MCPLQLQRNSPLEAQVSTAWSVKVDVATLEMPETLIGIEGGSTVQDAVIAKHHEFAGLQAEIQLVSGVREELAESPPSLMKGDGCFIIEQRKVVQARTVVHAGRTPLMVKLYHGPPLNEFGLAVDKAELD